MSQAQSNIKRLQYGQSKCVKLHIGCKENICTKNTIDTWVLGPKDNQGDVTSILDLVDKEGERHEMKTESSYKYLGDLAQSNGRHDLNIKERVNRGLVARNQIAATLEELCLGPYYFQSAMLLRNSEFLSTLLTNGETWFNLNKKDIDSLESADEALLRSILAAHSKTPKEMLYLALGATPVRYVLMSKRLNYLKYIINEDDGTMLKECFKAQHQEPTKGDWVTTVLADMEHLNINMTFDEIKNVSVNSFKNIVKKQIKIKALEYLQQCQQSHSKSKHVIYHKLEMDE